MHEEPASVPAVYQTAAGLHTWSLLNGSYAWCLATPSGCATGTVEGHDPGSLAIAVLDTLRPHLRWGTCLETPRRSPVADRVRYARRSGRRFAETDRAAAGQLAYSARDRLRMVFDGQLTGMHCWTRLNPAPPRPADADSFVIATDGSVRDRTQSWAYVTAGGWFGAGPIVYRDINVAELAAQIAGLQTMPSGAAVTLITDSLATADAWAAASAEVPWQRLPWMPPALARSMTGHLARLGGVTVEHHSRNTHPLQLHAHNLATASSAGRISPARPVPEAILHTVPSARRWLAAGPAARPCQQPGPVGSLAAASPVPQAPAAR